jgi:hypothetical protein
MQEGIGVGEAAKGEANGAADLAANVDGTVVLVKVGGVGHVLLRNKSVHVEQPVGGELGSVLDGSFGVEGIQLVRSPSASWKLVQSERGRYTEKRGQYTHRRQPNFL